jgi:LmbE family N-acetylglucosaminyl deacetylase
MRILAMGAHPDDLEIFAWGTLCAWRESGAELVLAVATDGARGGAATGLRETRQAEARRAAQALDLVPRFLDFPDGALIADRALDEALRRLIAETAPDLLVTHAPEDYHADHRALAAAALQAVNFAVPVLHMDTLNGTGFTPTHWVDITRHAAAKDRAILCHQSQDPARFTASVGRQNGFRAGECNGRIGDRAEAFRYVPRFPFADIRALLPPPPALQPVILRT